MKKIKLLSAAVWLASAVFHISALALGAKSGKMTPLSTVLTSVNAALALAIATVEFADYMTGENGPAVEEDAAGGETVME